MDIQFSLLDQALIRYRTSTRQERHATLPELLAAFNADEVSDFPALRPHQRHPWHAFLVQLAAIALHAANRETPFETAAEWHAALLALTPDDSDGAAFALVAPDDRPAFMQAPCERGASRTWKKRIATPDALDMLVTSRNHDLKAQRMVHAEAEDWIYALVSLQTQEGFLGAGNYGISRMNGGFASRPGVGVVPNGRWGKRWARDVQLLRRNRDQIAKTFGLKKKSGVALVWLQPWDGASSLSFSELDPFYIEVCRRVRIQAQGETLSAIATGSKVVRIAAKERCGVTGDAWTPINVAEGKALSITAKGFDYKLASTLAFSSEYEPTIARTLLDDDGKEGVFILAQGITRGQGKTEGYHERRIPITAKMRRLMLKQKGDEIAEAAKERIGEIADVRKTLWSALCALLGNGDQNVSDDTKNKANHFARAFEQGEDRRFFDDLAREIDADDRKSEEHDQWLLALADRASGVLEQAFVAGPRSAERVYRARGAALSRFHVGLRSEKAPPRMARVLKQRNEARKAAQSESFEEVSDGSN